MAEIARQPDIEGVIPAAIQNVREAAAHYIQHKQRVKDDIARDREIFASLQNEMMDAIEAAGLSEWGDGVRRWVVSKNRRLRECKDRPITKAQVQEGAA